MLRSDQRASFPFLMGTVQAGAVAGGIPPEQPGASLSFCSAFCDVLGVGGCTRALSGGAESSAPPVEGICPAASGSDAGLRDLLLGLWNFVQRFEPGQGARASLAAV